MIKDKFWKFEVVCILVGNVVFVYSFLIFGKFINVELFLENLFNVCFGFLYFLFSEFKV